MRLPSSVRKTDNGIRNALSSQLPSEELRRRVVGREPVRVGQKIMDLVRENELLEGYALAPQGLGELDRLAELHVAVVVAVDQQHRRAPILHIRDRRGFEGELRSVRLLRGIIGIDPV